MKIPVFFLSIALIFSSCNSNPTAEITPPSLENNPSWDVICNEIEPVLSFFVAHGGVGELRYLIQLDTDSYFKSADFREFKNVKKNNRFLVEKQIDKPLKDKNQYYWRVKAFDDVGNQSPWAISRFYIDSDSNKSFMNLVRVPVLNIEVSTGENSKNIIDYDDPGQITFWNAAPPGPIPNWVKFDLEKETVIKRIWMLSNFSTDNGRLADFSWQMSRDNHTWIDIPDAKITGNDTYTYQNILDISPIKTRYLRLNINSFVGVSPQINCIIFYSPGEPIVPQVPSTPYVLLIGDQMDGGTYTQLASYVESLPFGLKTVTVPHYEISLKMLKNLTPQPVAVLLSGNNADYPHLPMFEYNGVYEIVRNSDLPILGLCAGHHMLAFAYGYSFVHSMGWEDISALEKAKLRKPIQIVKNDRIFQGIAPSFIAPEIHGWAIAKIPEEFELLAKSSYVQNIRHKSKHIYGSQFHPEVEVSYNEGKMILSNFLEIALSLRQAAQSN